MTKPVLVLRSFEIRFKATEEKYILLSSSHDKTSKIGPKHKASILEYYALRIIKPILCVNQNHSHSVFEVRLILALMVVAMPVVEFFIRMHNFPDTSFRLHSRSWMLFTLQCKICYCGN